MALTDRIGDVASGTFKWLAARTRIRAAPSVLVKLVKARIMDIPSLTLNEVMGDDLSWSPTHSAIDLLSEVEIILGRDVTTQEVFLVYGRNRLKELYRNEDKGDVDVLMIDILRQTEELDQLLALVQLAKQGYDYVEAA